MPNQSPTPEAEEPKFEDALKKLEAIVKAMETGTLDLEESLAHFEEGTRLARLCSQKLGDVEKRIEVLVRRADNSLGWDPAELDPLSPSPDD